MMWRILLHEIRVHHSKWIEAYGPRTATGLMLELQGIWRKAALDSFKAENELPGLEFWHVPEVGECERIDNPDLIAFTQWSPNN